MSNSVITLTKLEAGMRQLRTAITLWFDEGDPVSTHALAFAAYEIFHSVSLHRNPHRRDLVFDTDWIKDEFRKDWINLVKRDANFFKHGDRDPEDSINFDPERTEMFILYGSYARDLCGCPQGEEESLFGWWLQINRPQIFTQEGRNFISDRIPVDALEKCRGLTRSQFCQVWREAGLHKKRPIFVIN